VSDRAILFIDGNNWYHSLVDLGLTDLGRLDYSKISAKLAGPRTWVGTRYYIGQVRQRGGGQLYADQRRFLAGLKATDSRISIHLGRLERRVVRNEAAAHLRRYLGSPPVRIEQRVFHDLMEIAARHESSEVTVEKAVDVMLAVDLVTMAERDELDAAYLLSADGDLTIRDYVTLLERLFLVEELPAWHTNRLKRLVKTPKLHVGDTGVGCAFLGLDDSTLLRDRATLGQMLETFVFNELKRQSSWQVDPVRFHHFRDRDGYEVDLVLERSGGAIAGVEVKAAATVTSRDFRGLRKLRHAAGERFSAGVVLYDGETSAGFGDRFFAVPIRTMWEGT